MRLLPLLALATACGGSFADPAPDLILTDHLEAHTLRVDAGTLELAATGHDALRLRTIGVGRADPDAPSLIWRSTTDGGLEGVSPTITEWWRADEGRLQQGWTLSTRPEGVGPVRLRVTTDADVVLDIDAQGAWIGDYRYDGLVAFDADGTTLAARLERDAGSLEVVVDDTEAVYPITIDPWIGLGDAWWSAEDLVGSSSFGSAVDIVGDVNGDGFVDVLVGQPYDASSLDYAQGAVFVYAGNATGPDVFPIQVLDGPPYQFPPTGCGGGTGDTSWQPTGDTFCDTDFGDPLPQEFGDTIHGIGDVDGDGFDDVLIGSPNHRTPGSPTGRIFHYTGSAIGLQPSSWFLEGFSGREVFPAGDVNNDGFDDVLIGDADRRVGTTSGAGWIGLYLGSAAGLAATPAWTLEGTAPFDEVGKAATRVGDINGDGRDDVVIATPGYDDDQNNEGQIALYLGTPAGLSPFPSWTTEGNADNVGLAHALAAGDVTGDGLVDLIAGSDATAVFGQSDGRLWLFPGVAGAFTQAPSWFLEGADGDGLGDTVHAGDLDLDGLDDLVAGEPSYAFRNQGRLRVFLGSSIPAAPQGDTIFGQRDYGQVGLAVSVGDANGDGYDDLLYGDQTGGNGNGAAYLHLGRADDADLDGIADHLDVDPNDRFACLDLDGDTCDDCVSGGFSPSDDGPDYDNDGACDAGDDDDDGDGVPDVDDPDPLAPWICGIDSDADSCDDCTLGAGPDPATDGLDTDLDGICDAGDDDDDGDTVLDILDSAPLDPFRCADADADTCDDCVEGQGADTANDGPDLDVDGICDVGDGDRDGDGVDNATDNDPDDATVCADLDLDLCDDCSLGAPDPFNDGPDLDADGTCDAGDSDRDGDGVVNSFDGAPDDPFACADSDADGCDDCSSGTFDTFADGPDSDGDGICDGGAIPFEVDASGVCPGRLTVNVDGATPNGDLALITGSSTGSFAIPVGPCAGTVVGLAQQGITLQGLVTADASGSFEVRFRAGRAFCGTPFIAVDMTTCAVTDVAALP